MEELKRQLQPKRTRTDDYAGDAHEMIAEEDNWDLSVHRREATHVQNRRNVCKSGLSTINRSLTQGTDGFLCQGRLGLVGCISDDTGVLGILLWQSLYWWR